MNSVGDRLREARLARGLTQEQLARGVATKGFISQIERNRTTPSLPKLSVMAERLGLPLGYFTGDKSPHELTYLRKSAELAVKAKEPKRALNLVNEGLSLPGTANERAELHRIRGLAFEELGRLRDALTSLKTAVATAPPDDPELTAAIFADIGFVRQQQEQFNAATEANLRALGWLDRSKHADPALRARILTNLGRSSYSLGQLESADEYFQRALNAATDAESLFRIANAHMALGVSARAVGDLARAVEHCNRAQQLHSRIGQHRDANRVLNNLGDVHYAAGRKRLAAELQQRCLLRAREMRDDFEIGVAAGTLARYALDNTSRTRRSRTPRKPSRPPSARTTTSTRRWPRLRRARRPNAEAGGPLPTGNLRSRFGCSSSGRPTQGSPKCAPCMPTSSSDAASMTGPSTSCEWRPSAISGN
jgi:tetratricopeptide (TPR) repeat protein